MKKERAVLLALIIVLVAPEQLGAQNFSNPYLIPTAQDPASVFVGDLNGDGLPDLLYETQVSTQPPAQWSHCWRKPLAATFKDLQLLCHP